MDFSLPITYQIAGSSTINFNSIATSSSSGSAPRSGYRVVSVTYGDTSLTGYIDKRALHDGLDTGDTYLTAKPISIICGVFGSSVGDFHTKLQNLLNAMRPIPRQYQTDDGFRNLAFSQATIDTTNFTSGYIPMMMLLRPASIPSVQLQSMHSVEHIATVGANSRGFSANVQLNFLARKPYKYRQYARSIVVSSSSATTTLPNLGSVIVYPSMEIVYSISSTYSSATVTSATFTFDNASLKLNGLDFTAKTSSNEVRWYVYFDSQTVYRGVRSTAGGDFVLTLRQDVIDTTTYLFGAIPPTDDSSTSLTTTYTGANIPGQLTLTYNEAWY